MASTGSGSGLGSLEQDMEMEMRGGRYDQEDGANGGENDSVENILESHIRVELLKGMQGNWDEVVKLCEQNPRVGKMNLDDTTRNTVLHLAALSGNSHLVERVVNVIQNNNSSEDTGGAAAVDVLSTPNEQGNSPLHLAALKGNVDMCKCILTSIGDNDKQLMLGSRNASSRTPLHMAAANGHRDAFFWLCEMCDSTTQVLDYCQALSDGVTVLDSAIVREHWDLAFQIIHRYESLMDSVDNYGLSPLHFLATKPTAFRSGIYLSFLDNIFYHCIHVEELSPKICRETKKLESSGISFFQSLWKLIKFPVTSRKSRKESVNQLDAENLEEGEGQHSSNEAKGHQGFPSRYSRYLRFIKHIGSKIVLVIFSIILGPSKIRKIRGIKEKHIWSLQIMNKLVDHAKNHESFMDHAHRTKLVDQAKKHESSTDPEHQTGRSDCRSAYGYFRRGKAKVTPILVAAQSGVMEMVEKILEAFPMTILDVDYDQRCIAQVAVENHQFHIFDFLLSYNHIVERSLVFDFADCESNRALHIAAMSHKYDNCPMATSMLQLQWKVKWYEYVKNSLPSESPFDLNKSGQRPDQIFTETHKELLDKSTTWINRTCNSCSFIAALIATVAFASSATVPGGVDQVTGKPIFQQHLAFRLFAISSLLALCSSFTSLLVFFTLLTSKCRYKDFARNLPLSLFFGLTSLFMSMVAMFICFCSGNFLMLDDTLKYVAIPLYAFTLFTITYFSFQQFPSFFVLMKTVFQRVLPGRLYHEDSL